MHSSQQAGYVGDLVFIKMQFLDMAELSTPVVYYYPLKGFYLLWLGIH